MSDEVVDVIERDLGIDVLRAGLTVLVVYHHAAITYGAPGDWFYRELTPGTSPTGLLLTLFVVFNQAWFMGFFFLLAGLFTPGAITRRGVAGYARERLLRLGMPLLVFGLVIGPATIALVETARGRPFWGSLVRLWSRGTFEIGPLWFAETLLVFGFLALVCFAAAGPVRQTRQIPFPSDLVLFMAALGTAVAAFALRLIWPVGRQVWGVQLGYLASYAVLFAAGCIGAQAGWWTAIPPRQVRLWFLVAAVTFPILPLANVAGSIIGVPVGRIQGGWTVGSAVYAAWEPFVAWGTILGLIYLARRSGTRLGSVWSRLGRASYGAFILHPLCLVAVALAVRGLATHPLAKVALVGAAASILAFAGALVLLRVPVLRRVL